MTLLQNRELPSKYSWSVGVGSEFLFALFWSAPRETRHVDLRVSSGSLGACFHAKLLRRMLDL
jgi:hypothetical protein